MTIAADLSNFAFSAAGVNTGGFTMRNKIINGAMVIDQRFAGASFTPANDTAGVDRWKLNASAASKYTAQQVADAPAGFTFSFKLTSSSAYTPGAGELFATMQPIEGFNFYDLAFGTASAATVTISFWVKSSLTGSFGGSISNYAQNRFYPFSYTINSANTWEKKTITLNGDTGGTWVGATNGGAAYLWFSIGAGSSIVQTAGSWTASSGYSAAGTVSVVSTNAATWQITGVQLEKGTSATPFEYRNYQQELAMCQRYFERWNSSSAALYQAFLTVSVAGNQIRAIGLYNFKASKRTSPTVTSSGHTTFGLASGGLTLTGLTFYPYVDYSHVEFSCNAATAGFSGTIEAGGTANAFVNFSAEL